MDTFFSSARAFHARTPLNDDKEIALSRFYHVWQVGLDIQNGFMRALAVQRRRYGWQLRQWWQIPLPTDTLREGSLQHSEALCEILAQWRRQLPHRISLRVGFPAQRVLQQRLTAPDRQLREPVRGEYIESQALRHFPIGGESLVLDYRDDPQAPGSVLVTAARRNEVAQWQHCLQRAGLEPDALDIVPCAIRIMAQQTGVPSHALLLQGFDDASWLWVSPLSQPLGFGVMTREEVTQAGDVLRCVSDHYHGEIGNVVYCSGVLTDLPETATPALVCWSPFAALQQVQPPLPLQPSQFVVAGGLALRAEDA